MPGTYVRPREIVEWLQCHAWLQCYTNHAAATFVAIDDRHLLGEEGGHLLKNRFAHTDPKIGIDGSTVQRAVQILNGPCIPEAWWDQVSPSPLHVGFDSPKENAGPVMQRDLALSRPPFNENSFSTIFSQSTPPCSSHKAQTTSTPPHKNTASNKRAPIPKIQGGQPSSGGCPVPKWQMQAGQVRNRITASA